MAWETFDDTCEGCLPVVLDPETGKLVPDDEPVSIAMKKIWESMTLEERQMFHRVTCLNSRDPKDTRIIGIIQERFNEHENPKIQ